jgi:predicted nucleic acid-binding protein
MTVACFLDSNILIYAASQNTSETGKKTIAVDLIKSTAFGISAQVLQEFYVVATRKAEVPLRPAAALEWIEQLEEFPCADISPALLKLGAVMSQRYCISYWDGAILAAAESLGAPVVYTEDLNHGQSYGAVRAINPFIETARAGGFHEGHQSYAEN